MSQVVKFVVFEDCEAGGLDYFLGGGGLGLFNLEAADTFLIRLKDEAVGVFDVDIVFSKGRGETLEIDDFVGDRDCQNIL